MQPHRWDSEGRETQPTERLIQKKNLMDQHGDEVLFFDWSFKKVVGFWLMFLKCLKVMKSREDTDKEGEAGVTRIRAQ